jgi:hypothetical protein
MQIQYKPGRKKTSLRCRMYYWELKTGQPLSIAFRRTNMVVKKRRAKYFAYEKKIFFMESGRCGIGTRFHITCVN